MNVMRPNVSDESGTLLEPNLHDGRLLGINLSSPRGVELVVSEVDGKRHRIFLGGVSQFCATNFREGNIILDVTITHSNQIQMSELRPLVDASHDAQRFDEELKRIYDRIMRESLYVLELNPSYGCHLIAVANSVRVQRDE